MTSEWPIVWWAIVEWPIVWWANVEWPILWWANVEWLIVWWPFSSEQLSVSYCRWGIVEWPIFAVAYCLMRAFVAWPIVAVGHCLVGRLSGDQSSQWAIVSRQKVGYCPVSYCLSDQLSAFKVKRDYSEHLSSEHLTSGLLSGNGYNTLLWESIILYCDNICSQSPLYKKGVIRPLYPWQLM